MVSYFIFWPTQMCLISSFPTCSIWESEEITFDVLMVINLNQSDYSFIWLVSLKIQIWISQSEEESARLVFDFYFGWMASWHIWFTVWYLYQYGILVLHFMINFIQFVFSCVTGEGPNSETMATVRDLKEFMLEAELDHYYSAFKNELKVKYSSY